MVEDLIKKLKKAKNIPTERKKMIIKALRKEWDEVPKEKRKSFKAGLMVGVATSVTVPLYTYPLGVLYGSAIFGSVARLMEKERAERRKVRETVLKRKITIAKRKRLRKMM